MLVFVFISHTSGSFTLGLMSETDTCDSMKVIKSLDAKGVRDLINSIPEGTNCTFVGKNTRKESLAPLLHELCKARLDLPEKLKFHWVPPFKTPIEDIEWLYNFGTFGDPVSDLDLHKMESNLGIEVTSWDEVSRIARIYFTLIGDFNKL